MRLGRIYGICTFIILLLLISACGKVGDPQPPIPKAPLIVNELAAVQQGTNVVLSFPVAKETRTDKLKQVDIYRLRENSDSPLGITEDAFIARAELIASLSEKQLPTTTKAKTFAITYVDPIDFKITNEQTRFRYAVRLVNLDNRAADLSNYATLLPLSNVALPPAALTVTVTQTQLQIQWQKPLQNLNGSQPANVYGYNLYLRQNGQSVKLNREVLTNLAFVERQFQFGATYEYFVRTLSLPQAGASLADLIESNESPVLRVTPKDTFAPTAPNSITIASRGGIVSLFWPANPEPDVIGYNIYRTENEAANKWTKITPRPITTITFNDKQVQSGKRYYYRITAMDNAGNESDNSAIVTEIAESN